MKINQCSPDDSKFLYPLTHLAKKPDRLYCIGTLPEIRRPTVAIVGTRKPTSYGKEVTTRLASDLATKGIVIVSGLALGVDGLAHRAALDANGTTIAVLGNGLPDIYPSSHRQLAHNIIDSGGAILSEYPSGTPALPHQFLERNRLVSGLADAIIITEAAARSGTLNTAMLALEQGKEVFVVPGNITSPMSAGCNLLLQQGATPVIEASDVMSVIAPDLLEGQSVLPLGSTPEEVTILELIQSGVRDGDELLRTSNLAPHIYSSTMTMLELSGAIRALGANQWTVK